MARARIRHIARNVKALGAVAAYCVNNFGLAQSWAVAEKWLTDLEGNRVDVSEEGWPI